MPNAANKSPLNAPIQGGQRRNYLRRFRPPETVLRLIRGAVETMALVLAIGAGVRAALLVASPLPAPPIPEAASVYADDAVYAAASLAGGHPFAIADGDGPRLAAPIEESALNIVLYGTWRGSAGAAAMLSADGSPQKKVAVGEEVISGVVLEEVQDEYVVINNQGSREAVAIANRDVDIAPLPITASDATGQILAQPSTAPLRDPSPEREVSAPQPAAPVDLAAMRGERLGDADDKAAAHEPE